MNQSESTFGHAIFGFWHYEENVIYIRISYSKADTFDCNVYITICICLAGWALFHHCSDRFAAVQYTHLPNSKGM